MKRKLYLIGLVVVMLICLVPTFAFAVDVSDKLTASDTASNYGDPIAVSGNTMVVGSYPTEAVYIYDLSAADVPGSEIKIKASDSAGNDYFGFSVAITGNKLVVGSNRDDDNGGWSGSVYIYDLSSGTKAGIEATEIKITASDGAVYDEFGGSVAISGNKVVVGAPDDDDKGSNAGAVYLYDISSGTRAGIEATEIKILASNGQYTDDFGTAIAISGNTMLVGAPGIGYRSAYGGLYGYDISSNTQAGIQATEKQYAGTTSKFGGYGTSIAISGDKVLVSAPQYDRSGYANGAVTMFKMTATGLEGQGTLMPLGAYSRKWFGQSVAVYGNLAVVGAPNENGNGAAYIYNLSSGNSEGMRNSEIKLTAGDAANSDYFGYAAAIVGNAVFIGAPGDDPEGSVYSFDKSTVASVAYDGNGQTNGRAPIDSNSPYAMGSTVTVIGNVGTTPLERNQDIFTGWNTQLDGSGTHYDVGDTFNISADTTLYAQWEAVALTGKSVYRTNATAATVRVNANAAGEIRYKITDSAAVPASFDDATVVAATAGNNSFNPSGLVSGDKYIHMILRAGGSDSSAVSIHMPYDLYFFEDFEGYDVDSYPDSFTQRYSGTGSANQKIISDGSNKAFRLQGAGGWASEHKVDLASGITGTMVLQADVVPVSGSWPLALEFRSNSGSWGERIVRTLMKDGILSTESNGTYTYSTMNYSLSTGYKFKIVYDIDNEVFDYYLNGVKVNSSPIAENSSRALNFIGLVAGNTGTNEAYFDNVEFYKEVSLTHAETPNITVQPSDVTCNVGDSETISVTASVSEGDLSYQWYSNSVDSNSGGTVVANTVTGYNTDTLTVPTSSAGTTYYYCVVTNTNNSATGSKTATSTSNTAEVVVNALVDAETPNITAQPSDVTCDVGDSETVSVTANVSQGTLSYQWYSNSSDSNSGGTAVANTVTGYNTDTLTVPTSSAGTTYYYCEVTNTDGSATGNTTATSTSNTAKVTVSISIYTVTYNANGGSGSTTPDSGASGSTITLDNGANFTRSGYIIDGWIIGGTTYKLGDLYTISGDVTANAYWVSDKDNDGVSDADESYFGTDPNDGSDEPQKGTIVIQIEFSDGSPASGYNVVLNSTPVTSTTNASGQATFAGVTLAPHSVSVRNGSSQIGSYSVNFSRAASNSVVVTGGGSGVNSYANSNFLTLNLTVRLNGTTRATSTSGLIRTAGYTARSTGSGIVKNPKTGDDGIYPNADDKKTFFDWLFGLFK